MVNEKNTLKNHVEGKIFKGYMIISNLKEKDFKKIDSFCKDVFENNRKQMLLSLIEYYNNDIAVKMLDDKLLLIYEDLSNRIEALEQLNEKEVPVEKKKNVWEGFKSK